MKKQVKPSVDVGVLGYGAYIPMNRIKNSEIARVWSTDQTRTPVIEKAVAGLDEDVITMSVEAARNALKRAGVSGDKVQAVYVGTESKPYAVKPSGTVVAEAIGASGELLSADFEFACKAGTETFQACIGLVGSGMVDYALGIGMDTAQGRPRDALEFTAASGGAAFLFAKKSSETLCHVEDSYSYVTDTPDFWRRQHEHYPSHGGRFTGEPAYFSHIMAATEALFEKTGLAEKDFDHAVFHQPNAKFPTTVARRLGFSKEKIKLGLLSPVIGNTYAGSSPVGLTNVLDHAKPNERILMVSYGSGAGSDAFSLMTQDAIVDRQKLARSTESYIARKRYIDYATYTNFRSKLRCD